MQGLQALVVIDMQQEFLTKQGNFTKNHISSDFLLSNVCKMIKLFRENHNPVVFVKSIYDNKGLASRKPGIFLQTTHYGKTKCCAKDSEMSKFHPDIDSLIEKNDVVVTKKWYSAFKETNLYDILNNLNTTHVYLVGLKTNVCIAATAVDAIANGIKVSVLTDCTSATTLSKHNIGIKLIENYGGYIENSSNIVFDLQKSLLRFGQGDCALYYNVLPKSISDNCFEMLKQEIPWKKMYHAEKAVSRLVCVQGDIGKGSKPIYRFPNDHFFELENWSPTMRSIRDSLQERLPGKHNRYGKIKKHQINHGKVQYYKDGNSFISAHSDKTLDIMRESYIINTSFGTTRTFVLKCKEKGANGIRERQEIILPHNSVLVFGFQTNMKWTHSVKKNPRIKRDRISIVFRNIATFEDSDGNLFGQGARKRLKKEKHLSCAELKNEQLELIRSFSVENKPSNFDWDYIYGNGFNVKDFSEIKK